MNKDSIPPMPIEGYFHVYAIPNRIYMQDSNGDTWDVTDYIDHEIRDGAIYIPSGTDFYAALEKAKQAGLGMVAILDNLSDFLESHFPEHSFSARETTGRTVIVKMYDKQGVNLANYETNDWNTIIPFFNKWLLVNK